MSDPKPTRRKPQRRAGKGPSGLEEGLKAAGAALAAGLSLYKVIKPHLKKLKKKPKPKQQ